MDITLEKKAHMFRLPTFLLEKLKELAAKDRRSLNNYVEGILLDAFYHEPNEVVLQAMRDSKESKTEGPIDTSSMETMRKSMGL